MLTLPSASMSLAWVSAPWWGLKYAHFTCCPELFWRTSEHTLCTHNYTQ